MADCKRKTANLCPDTGWRSGQYRDGVWEDTNTRSTSDFFPVSSNQYRLKITAGQLISFINFNYFDNQKQWLGNRTTLGMSTFSPTAQNIVIPQLPSNAAYMRITIRFYNDNGNPPIPQSFIDDSNIMVSEGTSEPSYEPPGWVHSLRKLGTDTDTITTLPADIYADDTTATVGLKGQTVQSSTPSPASPVTPQGCGERTNNLINSDTYYGSYKQSDGTYQTTRDNLYDVKIKPFTSADIGKTFTFSANISPTTGNTRLSANINGTVINGSFAEKSVLTFTVETINDSIFFNYGSGTSTVTTLSQVMLNEGNTALPYEPYGYKLDIKSGNTTTPVYLGEVQTTRKIKKLVLTGEETWTLQSINSYGIANFYTYIAATRRSALCTHFEQQTSTIATTQTEGFLTAPASGGQISFYIRILETTAATKEELKAWLAAQYANGTPVIIWYVDETQQAAIVNEPLMKIGDYADEVSNVAIPVTAGGDTISVGTTVQPSEVTANYHGWHTGAVHERESGQWNE